MMTRDPLHPNEPMLTRGLRLTDEGTDLLRSAECLGLSHCDAFWDQVQRQTPYADYIARTTEFAQ